MVLEPWPGGRWYRDLGEESGHLWGHVQVIKPPTLLELWGPMFMSFAGINHVQYRLTASGEGTRPRISRTGQWARFRKRSERMSEKDGSGSSSRIDEIAQRLTSERNGSKRPRTVARVFHRAGDNARRRYSTHFIVIQSIREDSTPDHAVVSLSASAAAWLRETAVIVCVASPSYSTCTHMCGFVGQCDGELRS